MPTQHFSAISGREQVNFFEVERQVIHFMCDCQKVFFIVCLFSLILTPYFKKNTALLQI
jgi:hypothetical protein